MCKFNEKFDGCKLFKACLQSEFRAIKLYKEQLDRVKFLCPDVPRVVKPFLLFHLILITSGYCELSGGREETRAANFY